MMEKGYGNAEFLDIFSSIISGFNQPLKQEHLQIFEHCLIPMHRKKFVGYFRQNLINAVLSFVKRDKSLAEQAIMACLRYWPLIDPNKEIASLSEIETILNQLKSTEHLQVVKGFLTKRIAICVCSNHYGVAEKALFLLHNPVMLSLLGEKGDENCEEVHLELVADALM